MNFKSCLISFFIISFPFISFLWLLLLPLLFFIILPTFKISQNKRVYIYIHEDTQIYMKHLII